MVDYDRDILMSLIADHFETLNHIYIYLISSSDYPSISMVDLARFIKRFNLNDYGISQTRIDQLYLQCILDQRTLNTGIMLRWSFIEFLVRLANDMYREKKVTGYYSEAFEMLIK